MLLIYQLQVNWINFVPAGTHFELFGSQWKSNRAYKAAKAPNLSIGLPV